MNDTAIVILAKAPERGRVKTRLAASLGHDAALAMYRTLLQRTWQAVATWPWPVLLMADGNDALWVETPFHALPRQLQPNLGLGSRIAAGLTWAKKHASRALAIGTDCPGITQEHLLSLANLYHQDLSPDAVFGPAADGGYWGVGIGDTSNALPCLSADDLPWSSAQLLTESCRRLTTQGYTYALGPTLHDCDTLEDYRLAVTHGFLPPCLDSQ